MLDVDFVSQAQQLADAGYDAAFVSVLPEDQAAMFARIQDQVAGTSLPGYESEPEEALRQLVQVGDTSCGTVATALPAENSQAASRHVFRGTENFMD